MNLKGVVSMWTFPSFDKQLIDPINQHIKQFPDVSFFFTGIWGWESSYLRFDRDTLTFAWKNCRAITRYTRIVCSRSVDTYTSLCINNIYIASLLAIHYGPIIYLFFFHFS